MVSKAMHRDLSIHICCWLRYVHVPSSIPLHPSMSPLERSSLVLIHADMRSIPTDVPLAERPLLVTSAADTLVEILHEFENIVEATMVQSSMEVNVGALEKLGELAAKFRQHRKDIEERNDAPPLPEATAGSGGGDGGGAAAAAAAGVDAAAGGGKVAAAKPSASDILSGIGGSRTSGAASAAKSRRALLSGVKAKKETPFSRLRKFIVESLKGFFETELVPPTSNLLASGFFFEGSLKGMLEGSPRGTIENALNSPSQYLGDSMASQPDTVILYTLHLECGRLVNIYDLLMSFAEVSCLALPSLSAHSRNLALSLSLSFLPLLSTYAENPTLSFQVPLFWC